MSKEVAIATFLQSVKLNPKDVSPSLLQSVNDEIKLLEQLTKNQKDKQGALSVVKRLVNNFNKGAFIIVQQKCKEATVSLNAYLKELLEDHYAKQSRGPPTEPTPDYDQEPQDVHKDTSVEYQGVGTRQRAHTEQKATVIQVKHMQQDDTKTGDKTGQQAMHEVKPKNDTGTTAASESNQRGGSGQQNISDSQTDRRNTSVQRDSGSGQRLIETENDSSKGRRGQEKGKGDARSNTSCSRPEVLAGKFKALYDDIWPDAHDDLLEQMKIGDEKKVVGILLNVVQDANKFCKKEAEEQISSIALECLNIVRGKPGAQKEEISKINLTLIKEFRQANAGLAVPRLQKEFLEVATKSYFLGKKTIEIPEKLKEFCNRAVELLWWMNMHEPSVYVCPTSSMDDYVSDAYKWCTNEIRPGDKPWYFVWPAVREHEKGALIEAGFVDSEIKVNPQITKF